jgi:CPA1 family monovalent cation:H+ antiporter
VFNDGTAIVLFTVALAALSGGTSIVSAAVSLVVTVSFSVLIGVVAGAIGGRAIALSDDHLVELSITLVLAYGTYMLADGFHLSGIIATVVAAITFGIFARRGAMTDRAQEAVDTVWEFAAYLLSALLFVLIGLVINVGALGQAVVPIGSGVIGVVVSRMLIVYGLVGGVARVVRRPAGGLDTGWLHVMTAAGMRGAVSVALALSLPANVPERELLVAITFGITLFTLVVQGLALDPIVRRSLPNDAMRYDAVIPTS